MAVPHHVVVAVVAASRGPDCLRCLGAGAGPGRFLLMQQATIGVLDGKKTAKSDARQAVNTAQQQLNAPISPVMSTSTSCSSTWPPGSPVGPGAIRGDHHRGRPDDHRGNAAASSIPPQLRRQVEVSNDLLMTSTQIDYRTCGPRSPDLRLVRP